MPWRALCAATGAQRQREAPVSLTFSSILQSTPLTYISCLVVAVGTGGMPQCCFLCVKNSTTFARGVN